MYEYNANITNVVDGDTYDMDIDLGFHGHIHERIRVLDLETPKKRGEERELGEIVTTWADENLFDRDVIIRTEVELAQKQDSFGRWLAEVVLTDDEFEGQTITEIMSRLRVNKLQKNYSEECVRKLAEAMNDGK